MKFVKCLTLSLVLLFVTSVSSHSEIAGEYQTPAMTPALLDGENYSEFWQQVFLFEDGTFLTSEFLIANFGFSTHHGIMLSTLVCPNGDRYIIKNGRRRSGWDYQSDPFSIQIFQHSLSATADGLVLNLDNTMAQVNLNLTPVAGPIESSHIDAGRDRWQEVSFFAPALRAEGYWTPGPETGLEADYETRFELKGGYGFGIHAVQSASLHELMASWLKVFGYGGESDAKPFINSIVRPDGEQENVMSIHVNGLGNQRFDDIELHVVDTQEINGSSVPRLIRITAISGEASLSGTLELTEILETFVLSDHLNALELVASRGEPTLKRFRFRAEYNFVITGADGEDEISGNALSEFIDVVAPQASPRRRSRR